MCGILRKTLILALTVVALSGCTKQETKLEPVYTDVVLNGDRCILPFKADKLEMLGYSPMNMDADAVISGNDNVVYFSNYVGEVITVNLGTRHDDTPLYDSFVIDILADVGNTSTSRLRVYGNIGLDSTVSDIKKVYGEPAVAQGDTELYTMSNEDGTKGVYVAVAEDKVVRIEALNTLDFIQKEE